MVVLAQEEARLLNHNYIGTEHLLLGLAHEGVAATALESLGISLEAIRAQVEEIIGQGQSAPTGHIPFTPRAKKVLELSLREAKQWSHNYAGGEAAAEQARARTRLVRMTVPEELREAEQQLAQVRREKEAAIDAEDFEQAAALRDQERQLVTRVAERERAWTAGVDLEAVVQENENLHREVERLRALLRRHGIEPDSGIGQTA